MIRLSELIRIPDSIPAKPKAAISPEILQSFRERASQLLALCVRTGVMNPDDARDFVKKAKVVIATVEDLEYRLTLRESIDYGEVDDLRFQWKSEYRDFLKFRDTIRYTLNILTQNGFVSVRIADAVKTYIDQLYEQIKEIDGTVQSVLRRL